MTDFTKALGTGGLILQGVGALTSAIGNYYQAKTQKRQMQFESAIGKLNARYAEQAAQIAEKRGVQRQQASRLAAAQLKGKQKVAFAANGVDLSSDTAARIMAGTDLVDEVSALTISQDTAEDVWNNKRQATNLTSQSAMSAANAKGISPGFAGFASLLGDAGSVASSWYQYRKERT